MATPSVTSVPLQLGKYAVSEVLGKGSMGVVYKAFDPHIRRTVALKTIRKELVDDDQAATVLARFRNEAQAAGRLSHPGIVSVYEWGEAGDLVFLAMEYVQGNSLREYFNRGKRFDIPDTVSIMVQLLEALHYAHQQGVWHRDVKPANVILMNSGKLKIADFGIARIDSSNLTQTGAIMGTPGYMAPEQYKGHAVDWRADIFSAGVVMYQLLTGFRPFTGSPESIAYKICHLDAIQPSEAGRCTSQFDQVVMSALAKNPDLRYENAHAFREAMLQAYAAPVSPAVSEETIINEPIRPSGAHDSSQPSPASSPSQPSRPSQPSQPTGSIPDSSQSVSQTVPPPGWDAALLRQIEKQLAAIVGPVAKVMVRRGAASTSDVDRLYRMLGEGMTNHGDREAFLAGRQRLQGELTRETDGTPVPGAPGPGTGLTTQVTPEVIELAAKLLTNHFGPIAKVLAKKAATQSTSRHHFHQLLAEKLTDPAQRAQFLRDVGD